MIGNIKDANFLSLHFLQLAMTAVRLPPKAPQAVTTLAFAAKKKKKKRGHRPLSCCRYYTFNRLPPSLSLGTNGNLSIVVILAGVLLVHQVAAKIGDIEPDGRT